MILREMAYEDADQVHAIECACFSQPWTRESILGEIESDRAHYLVADESGHIYGYVGFRQIFDEGHITNIAVSRQVQGKGIGSRLVEGMLGLGNVLGIKSYTLEVRVGNAPAIALYEKYGFETAGIRKGFYDLPKEDALIMWRKNEE